MRQALLSRPQLEAVARKTDLHLRAKTPEEMEALLDSLQKHIIVVNAVRAGNSDTDGLYRISFQDNNRQISLAVVETLLNNFVEQTLGSKRTGQESAQRFLEDEIRELERRLTESETRLADFKKKNVGSMPGEGGDYFARLQTEIVGEKTTRDALALADTRRNELQRQLSGEDPFLFGLDSGAPGAGNDGEAGGDITYRIQELEARLEEMLLRVHREASGSRGRARHDRRAEEAPAGRDRARRQRPARHRQHGQFAEGESRSTRASRRR